MAIYHMQEGLPEFRNAVLTIGSFDGVHQGHKKILRHLVEAARSMEGESIVITFDPHPRKVIRPDIPIQLISSEKDKYEEILKAGVDHIVIVPFTRSFSLMNAEEYVQHFLIEKFKPRAIIIGYDHQFGHDRRGNIHLLRQLIGDAVNIMEISAQLIDDANVSSTKIRNAVSSGDVAAAMHMLGRPYTFSGLVIQGKKLGRELGYPTANLKPVFADQLLPPSGIYAVQVKLHHDIHDAVMSIGKNPTVNTSSGIHYEVHIFGFNQDIYGQELDVYFIDKIRNEEKFDSLEKLVVQIGKDADAAREMLARYKGQ